MYDVALVVSGFSIEKTDVFADRINRMIKLGLAIDDDDEDNSTSDMPALETGGDGVEASKMEEVD
jgi:molecular chaperone HtpG